jgi:hypothetical protein
MPAFASATEGIFAARVAMPANPVAAPYLAFLPAPGRIVALPEPPSYYVLYKLCQLFGQLFPRFVAGVAAA